MKKILIIENDEFLSDTYNMMLANERFETQIASDSEEAILQLQAFQPDLIILDLLAAHEKELAILERIKSNVMTKSLPIIATTDSVLSNEMNETIRSKVQECIAKTNVSLDDLLEKCKKYLYE